MMEYQSHFAGFMVGLIEEKRALGYKYECQAAILKRFDRFCVENYPDEATLSKEIVLHWSALRQGEHPKTLEGRVVPVRELGKYMRRLGFPAFTPPKGMLPRAPKYQPYIYSNDELKRIFKQTDQCRYYNQSPYRHLVMPVFFRLLYGCGLRVTEACLLKVRDVDLDNGIILITNAKLDRHRQITVSPQLLERLKTYHQQVHMFSKAENWFFPGCAGNPLTRRNVEENFRKFLWKAGISHAGRSNEPGQPGGPRVHDFRHTFSVHCLRRWVAEGKDLQAYLPVLQAYLGHVSLKETAYYLHLTADLFPDITERLESALGNIIPKAGECDETY